MSNKDYYEIHTSDRILFKRCRRKWYLRSPLKMHLVPKDTPNNIHLWFGTGFHFALEDYHGYNRFGHPSEALQAYYDTFKMEELPEGAEEMIELGKEMFNYYLDWLQNRDMFQTVWMDGKPMVEVPFELELEELSEIRDKPVIYRGTIDRIVQDEYGDIWVQDYKTAKNIDTNKLANDPQITTYVWAAEQILGQEIEGMVYTQFAKDVPKKPKILKDGSLSTNKQQKTTAKIFKEEAMKEYPDGNLPSKYIEFINLLADRETIEGDRFIRSDTVHRNEQAKISTYNNIIAEAKDMTDNNLSLYPNPTRDCSWDCAEFRTLCLAMDEGDDYEYMINEFYEKKKEEDETWKARIKYPQKHQQ